MSDDVRAASGRLRRIHDWSRPLDVYGADYEHDYSDDVATIVQAYLREHPADDAEPITEDWLRAVTPFFYCDKSDLYSHRQVMLGVCDGRTAVWIGSTASGCSAYISTRGDLRLLANALGIELKGGNGV